MRDGVRYVSNTVDEVLDLIKHAVERLRKHVEFVRSARRRQPLGQVPFDDGAGRLTDDLYLGEKSTTNQQPTEDANQQDDARSARKPIPEESFQRPNPGDVTPTQEVVPAWQERAHEDRLHRGAAQVDRQVVRAGRFRNPGRPGSKIPGKTRQRSM